ncbi:hypothetical protein G6F68_016971 [Rhizopus microsporus]|nr:hypothetical protein G6F68_016971 [Rhizopus microsporus]
MQGIGLHIDRSLDRLDVRTVHADCLLDQWVLQHGQGGRRETRARRSFSMAQMPYQALGGLCEAVQQTGGFPDGRSVNRWVFPFEYRRLGALDGWTSIVSDWMPH